MRNSLLEVLFPRFCLGCGYVGTYICQRCESKMKRVNGEKCFYCNQPTLYGLTHPGCKTKQGLDGYVSVYLYNGLFKELLHESKYNGAYMVLKTVLSFPQNKAWEVVGAWNKLFTPIVTSVPLHPQRLRERGFNQAQIIADEYSKFQLNTQTLLKRIQNTKHIAHINNKMERKRNIRGAFKFCGNALPQATLLIDDVITSGSTILECTKVLKENGVRTVLALSLAKG